MDTVTTVPAPTIRPEISFATSPQGAAYEWEVGGTVYAPDDTFYTLVGEAITFTPSVRFYETNQYAVGYEWDFGDGTRDWGPTVSHVYLYPSAQTLARLTVTDNKGRRFRAKQQIYLRVGSSLAPEFEGVALG